jgi:hypothetical protein
LCDFDWWFQNCLLEHRISFFQLWTPKKKKKKKYVIHQKTLVGGGTYRRCSAKKK